MINDIADLDNLKPALRELKKAAEACRRMAKVGVGSFSEYDDAWRAVLTHVDRTWNKLQAAARDRQGWHAIEYRCRRLRKEDPLLLYVRQARNVEEHTITPIAKDWDPEMNVVGSILSFNPWSRTLLPVTNRGKTFQPPKEHLDIRLENASPLDVANAAITFYCKLYNDVLTEVYGVVPEVTEDI